MRIEYKRDTVKKPIVLLVVVALLVLAGIVWRFSDLTGESTGQVTLVDAEQAVVERTLQRTFRESRTGAEVPSDEAAPVDDSPPQAVFPPQAVSPEPGVEIDALPEGYTPGTYFGPMQRAPRTGVADSEPSSNPAWLESASAHDAILDQAARAARPFTFAVLRVLPGTDLQILNRSLAALGSQIEGSTGPYVRVRVPAERGRLESIAGLAGVLGIGAMPPGIKAVEAFVQAMRSRAAGELVPVYITLMAADPAGEWRRALAGLGVVVGAYDNDLRSYTANLPAAALGDIVAADFVMSVEPVPVVTANHASAVPVMGVDGLRDYDAATQRFSGLTGSGIAVGVLDTGLNTSHMDIAHGRSSICGASFVTDENWDLWLDLHGHGTHVFGTIAGAGRVNPLLAGTAPGLSHLRFGKVLSAHGYGSGDDIRRGMDYLSRATSCTWRGTVSEAAKPLIVNMSLSGVSLAFSGRGVGERKLDSVVRAHSQLYVVAQANAGVHGFSNYGTAKNSLAVGAVDDAGIIAWFSSQGPTSDGRLAPNVVGTGVDLTSARGGASVSGHITFSGTSMASPSVAGVAALLMEARPEFQDRPALARARLMASAIRPQAFLESGAQLPGDNTDGPGSFNNLYGLGLVSAQTSLYSHDDPEGWLIGSASSQPDNDTYEYIDIEVPAGVSRMDVVLTWDEQPADTLTRSVLNNLDLWADQGAECEEDACGEHASRSEVDNVEWLLIEDPVPGAYRIKVVPVEVYGESSTAAVAWKILRGEPTPQLDIEVEDTSASATSEYITVDVTVDADRYVASGTTLHLGCRTDGNCYRFERAYLPHRNRVYREDGLNWSEPYSTDRFPPKLIPVGEVAAGTPTRVQLLFLREDVPPESVLHVTASAWNAEAAGQSLAIGMDAAETGSGFVAPANDGFSAAERIEGAAGETALDLAPASREPGEPLVSGDSRTVWYAWEAPAKGLFRFRLQEQESGDPVVADFALFTGGTLVDLDMAVEKKSGNEISFAAQAGTDYRLRIASNDSRLPPLTLKWESADSRPANDDFAYAEMIERESGSIESTNEGATLESSEFQGGRAATVWYEWTAPEDGWWWFEVNRHQLAVSVFAGARVDELRLLSDPGHRDSVGFRAKAGETYRIAMAAGSADQSGSPFTLTWSKLETQPENVADNDLFENAIEIDGSDGLVSQLLSRGNGNFAFSVEPGEPMDTGIGTGWWQWTAPADGRYTWRMDGGSGFRLTFLTGDALENLQFVGSLQGGSAFVLDATGDTRYWIAFGRAPEYIGDPMDGPDAFTWGPTPANDDRAAASPIVGSGGSTEAMLVHATTAANEPADTVGTDSVWWHWSAPASGWQRFWVEEHPLSTILAVYPDSAATQATADSEQTFLANGRVEVHVLAMAGHRYEVRLSSRPGVGKERTATLRWAASDAPAFLAYKGAVTTESLADNAVSQGFRSPRNLAMSHDGNFVFASSDRGLFGFLRDTDTGELALAYRASARPEQNSGIFNGLQLAHLWWNDRDDRLLALTDGQSYSFALPEDESSLLTHSEITLHGAENVFSSLPAEGAGSPDGQHFYAVNRSAEQLRAFRVDSPTQFTLVQTVSPQGTPGDDALIVPDIRGVLDMTLSSDGLYLYAAAQQGLFVFSRDGSSGRLELEREILQDNSPDGPFHEMRTFKNVSLDADGSTLFVSGMQSDYSAASDTAIAAFDVSAAPSNPAHLDTLTGLYFEQDLEAIIAWNHLQPRPGAFTQCNHLVAHADLPAVDVFCSHGYYVVVWNPATNALEVTDFAVSGADDRFGNRLPYHLGESQYDHRRQMAQGPDGAQVYRTTSVSAGEYSDAIHVFERASALTPAEADEDGGDEVAETAYGVNDTLPGVPTSGAFAPTVTSGGSVTITGDSTTIALNDGGYVELSDGTRYTCTSADGCTISNGTVTGGTVTGRAADSGDAEVDRFPSFRTADGPGDQAYTVGTAIDTLTLPEASGGNGTLSYTLTPSVPGLTFGAATRRLTGTPSTAGSYAMTFTASDEDDDTDSLRFNIEVNPDSTGTSTVSRTEFEATTPTGYASVTLAEGGSVWGVPEKYTSDSSRGTVAYMLLGTNKGCSFANAEADRAGTVYVKTESLGSLSNFESVTVCRKTSSTWNTFSGVRMTRLRFYDESSPTHAREYVYNSATGQYDETIPAASESVPDPDPMAGSFELGTGNDDPDGIAFASDRLYVVDGRDDKVYAYQTSGQRDAASDFELGSGNTSPTGIAFANDKFFVLDWNDDKVYAYSASGQSDAASDFDLDSDNRNPHGITFANGRFYVTDEVDDKVYAYQSSGQRDAASDFDLDAANGSPLGIAFANDRFHVADSGDLDWVYAYGASGQRDAAHDFHLDATVTSASGIAFAGGRFYVTNDRFLNTESRDRVYVVESIQQSPELVLRSMSVSDDAPSSFFYSSGIDVTTGDAFRARTTALNRGTSVSTATTLRFYRSDDRTISTGDTQVDTASVEALSAAGSIRQQIGLTVPSTAATYYYGACIDAVAGESDTANNCSSGVRVTVKEPAPDLVVESESVSDTTPDSEGSFTFSATVRNRGTGASTATTLRYYRSDDRSVSSSDTQVGTSSVGSLAADGSASHTISLQAPSTAVTNNYGACVDSVAEESQTRNNCSGAVAVFGGGPFPAYDLTISSATLHSPSFVIFGSSSISMTVTVTNGGPNASQPSKLRFSGGTLSYLDIPAIESGESETFERHRVGAARLGTTTYRACIVEAPGEENADNNCQSRSVTYFLSADSLSGRSQ